MYSTKIRFPVTSTCDHPDCDTVIFRGMDTMCVTLHGDLVAYPPAAVADTLAGCGSWYCEAHLEDHECARPACGLYDATGRLGSCRLIAGHESAHSDSEFEFTQAEEA